ncbi:MAG: dihydrofolate reductase [Lachnospiraceae bacterium]|nr:dihydrofolate reductase [Lachnospiraceae bacterium]
MVGLIVAYAHNRVIGNKGMIPWRIKGEQRRFKELTTGNVVIMGRRSYDEIGHPLPNRFTIVVSSSAKYEFENCTTVSSVAEAIEYAKKNRPGENIYLSGGAGIYKEGLPLAEKLFITEVDLDVEGDTFFPEFDKDLYVKTVDEVVDGEIPYSYVTYTRKDTMDCEQCSEEGSAAYESKGGFDD